MTVVHFVTCSKKENEQKKAKKKSKGLKVGMQVLTVLTTNR